MSGLTPGLLRVIHTQVGHTAKVTAVALSEKWKGVCLHQQDLDHLLLDGKYHHSDNVERSILKVNKRK